MLSPLVVGRLRSIGIWQLGQTIHDTIAPPLCAGIHHVVRSLAPSHVPLDLKLKHHYDYEPMHIDPRMVAGRIPVLAGIAPARSGPRGLVDRYRTWRNLDGGWKSIQEHVSRNISGRFIVGGDWDRSVTPFDPIPSAVEIFDEGLRPEDTEEYRKLVSRVENNDLVWTRGFRTVRDVDDYFDELIRIHDDMKTNGYRTQSELGNSGADEIRVCIDRNGELSVFGGGTHRLSMALLLGLDSVPVLIKRVHAQWVAACVQRFGGEIESAITRGVRELECEPMRERALGDEGPVDTNPGPDTPPHPLGRPAC